MRELTQAEAYELSVRSKATKSNLGSLDDDKQKVIRDILSLTGFGFDVTISVYKNQDCRGYFEPEDLLLKNYKGIKKWLKSLGYKVELFPAAWVPCEQHFLTVDWRK